MYFHNLIDNQPNKQVTNAATRYSDGCYRNPIVQLIKKMTIHSDE